LNLYESREVCKGGSQEVQDEWLCRVNTLVECGVKMSNNNEGEKINSITLKSLVESLRYLTCTRPNIIFGVGLVSRFMKTPIMTHFK
jgi:hypothetical protein